MRINLEINNQTKSPVKKNFFNAVVKKTLKEFNLDLSKNCNISLSIALVDREEIKKLNKVYRKKNQVTDVLSFAEYKNTEEIKEAVDNLPHRQTDKLFLGELILCYDDIREYAEKKRIKLEKELAKVVSHGILHLLGMRHGKNMFDIQNKISDSL